MGGRVCHGQYVGGLNGFLQAIRRHGWDDALPASAAIFPEDIPDRGTPLPRALAGHVMAQVEQPANLDRQDNPAYRLITMILIRCGLRISSAARLPFECLVTDADGAPYLRYWNTKMKREALVPIDDELHRQVGEQQQRVLQRFPSGAPVLFPRPTRNLDGRRPVSCHTYRCALNRWLENCDIRDEHGQPVHLTPHQWRHTLGTVLINRDVPQHVVQKILDHDSPLMTAHYARLSDKTVRDHWERARKVDIAGASLSRSAPTGRSATRPGPSSNCHGLPRRSRTATASCRSRRTCPHANSCLTCPIFVTTAEFLPQHHAQRQATLQIITAAEAERACPRRGNEQAGRKQPRTRSSPPSRPTAAASRRQPPMPPDALADATARRHELTRAKAIQALRELDRAGAPVTFASVVARPGSPGPGSIPSPTSQPDPEAARRRRAARPRAARTPAGHRSIAARQAHRRPRPQQAARRGKRPASPPTRPGTRRPAVSTARSGNDPDSAETARTSLERPVGDTVHDETPQVTAPADAKAQDNVGQRQLPDPRPSGRRPCAAARAASQSVPSPLVDPLEHRGAPRDRTAAGTGGAASTTPAAPEPAGIRRAACCLVQPQPHERVRRRGQLRPARACPCAPP